MEIISVKKEGVGTIRRLTYVNGITFLETVVEDDGAKEIRFELSEHPFPVTKMFAILSLEMENSVTFEIRFIANSKITKYIFKHMIQSLVNEIALNFKVLVESGRPCKKKGNNLSIDTKLAITIPIVFISFLFFAKLFIYRLKYEKRHWLNSSSFMAIFGIQSTDIYAFFALAVLFIFYSLDFMMQKVAY